MRGRSKSKTEGASMFIRNSFVDGQGKRTFDSGDVYEGRFRNGRPDGRGVLRKADDSYIYDGDWCDGMMHGDGEIIWEKHKEYIRYLGEFKENIRQGRGMLETKDGTIYKGHFINGSMIKGRIILQDESVYEGEVKGGVPHGTGTMHWSNGTTFHGEWLHGAPYGLGEQSDSSQSTLRGCFGEAGVSGPGERTFMVTLDGQDSDDNNASQNKYVYKGDMIDNKMHGNGKLLWPDGRIYEGEFRADAIEGQGTMIWPAGTDLRSQAGTDQKVKTKLSMKIMNTYQGRFRNGLFSGEGTLKFANGVVYQGKFKCGRYHGLGKIDMSAINQGQYSGQWEDGRIFGKGTRIWDNGDAYIGDFGVNGKLHGQGSFVWKNGSQYVGEFAHGERSGSGKQIWESGKYYIGEWKDGHPEGKGVLVDPNMDSEGDRKNLTIGIWGKNGLIKELVVGNNSIDNDACETDDVAVFESLRTSLETTKIE